VIALRGAARPYVGLRWSKYSTQSTVCASGVLPCSARVWGINRVLLRTSIYFYATLLDTTSRIKRLHFCYYCIWRVLAHFVANTVAHIHRRRVCVAVFMTRHVCRSAVRAQRWLFQRLLGLFVARCGPMRKTHYKQAVCSEWWAVDSL